MHLMNFATTLCRRVNLKGLVTKAPVYNGLHDVEGGLGLMIRRWATDGSTQNDRDSNFFGLNTNNSVAEHLEQRVNPVRGLKSMNFVRSILEEDEQLERKKMDVVHIRMIKNNTFVTVTDAMGNKKTGASTGCLEEFKGGARFSKYSAEATAEHVGRSARNLGLKSVVMKVKGNIFFRKKKTVILSWRDGYTYGESKRSGAGDGVKILYVRDVTQLPHNGCRLPKQRRV